MLLPGGYFRRVTWWEVVAERCLMMAAAVLCAMRALDANCLPHRHLCLNIQSVVIACSCRERPL